MSLKQNEAYFVVNIETSEDVIVSGPFPTFEAAHHSYDDLVKQAANAGTHRTSVAATAYSIVIKEMESPPMEIANFFVSGNPVSAPRQSQRDKHSPSDHVLKYRAWRDELGYVGNQYLAKYKDVIEDLDETQSITLGLVFYLPMPNWPDDRQPANAGKPHTGTPDLSNLIKAVEDALKGIAWPDDRMIAEYFPMRKMWAYEGHEGVDIVIKYPVKRTEPEVVQLDIQDVTHKSRGSI